MSLLKGMPNNSPLQMRRLMGAAIWSVMFSVLFALSVFLCSCATTKTGVDTTESKGPAWDELTTYGIRVKFSDLSGYKSYFAANPSSPRLNEFFIVALEEDGSQAVELALEAGVDPNLEIGPNNDTPLIIIAIQEAEYVKGGYSMLTGYYDDQDMQARATIAKTLIEYGADVTLQNGLGNNALFYLTGVKTENIKNMTSSRTTSEGTSSIDWDTELVVNPELLELLKGGASMSE